MKFWQKLSAATVLTGLVAGLTPHIAAAPGDFAPLVLMLVGILATGRWQRVRSC